MKTTNKQPIPIFLKKGGTEYNLSAIVRVVDLEKSLVLTFSDNHSSIFNKGDPETGIVQEFINQHRINIENT